MCLFWYVTGFELWEVLIRRSYDTEGFLALAFSLHWTIFICESQNNSVFGISVGKRVLVSSSTGIGTAKLRFTLLVMHP